MTISMKSNMRARLWALIFLPPALFSQVTADTTIKAADRLRPINTSSPRGLIESMQRETRRLLELYDKGDLPVIRRQVQRVIRIFDFTNTPPALISQQGPEHFWQLVDITGRLPEPDLNEVPDAEHVRTEGITSWSYPNTELTIHRVAEGPREGEFLMSPETFKRIPEFYAKVADLPKRPNAIVPIEAYQLYRNGAGSVFPAATISKLPEPLQRDWLGQPGWKWPVLLAILCLIVLLAWPFYRLRPKHVEKPRDDNLGLVVTLRRLVLPVYAVFAMQVLDYLLSRQLRLTGMGLTVSEIAVQLISLVALAYLLNLLISLLAEAVIKILHTRRAGYDSQLIRLAFRILFWVITLFASAVISEHIGVPVAALAAGIGVGGLAFALASQSTLENLVAGLTIYGDRPIRVGDFCTIGAISGTVESIGLRSTRLRTLARTLVTIPNAEVAKQILENSSVRDKMLMRTTLGLRYETSPDQLRYVLGRLRELFNGHPKAIDDGMRVRFIGFGAYSLDIEIYLYVMATRKPAFLEICEDLNLRIMDIIEEAGAGFAFPSQTAYLARDTAPDAERMRAAENHVEAWRETGELPFPDFSPEAQDVVDD
jgi:MscS family membrane protein